ncbi:SDR family oxidoreductase [Dyadobacter sp. CY356]|uniref:SDR family oxidoreductase n=1 Tax=Dyadobacter sp. CY356 TaxID=2906442 RepID=UPI001F295713|nr:SDR family oxidoreductase [Dyadobacter sp. CY356]MCF0056375.1 SDR family oxidoreductase [Dyadobacter sp. CY356]
MKKIFVTGATGHLGSAVISKLLTEIQSKQISVLTRNSEKQKEFQAKGFHAFLGSYDDVTTLEKAMENVEVVLLISSGDQGDRMQDHKNVVDAAKKTGIKSIAYTSRCLHDRNSLVNKLMDEHFETEDYIKASGLAHTFFRNILYMDAIPQFIGGKAALDKGIFLPAGNGKVAFALRSEMGEAMAKVLLAGDCENKIYNFTGDKAYSFYDIATALSELSGNLVSYNAIDDDTFTQMMQQRNVPNASIRKIIDFITDIRHNQEQDIYDDLETVLGRKPASLKEGLKTIFGL